MPLEIRELIIKTTVSNNRNATSSSDDVGKMSEYQMNKIADRIFEILKEKSER